MRVYRKLLLGAGGGIVSEGWQAEQVKNTASIMIGLGGTGIDCLRTLKTQVYKRLKPDNPDSSVTEYKHIKFLGIDTDQNVMRRADDEVESNKLYLDETEFFDISSYTIGEELSVRHILNSREEFAWLRYDICDTVCLGNASAGGIRQLGRYMLIRKSKEFIARMRELIDSACEGLDASQLDIHIFSGLGGGTGSGIFLDVCYLIRSLTASLDCNVFGYFFLPDVNLSKIPADVTSVRDYIRKNGYAAMKELEYCMNLESNGGGFTQDYGCGIRADWKTKPVDNCYLISAMNEEDNAMTNAYNDAMNITAENVVELLTKGNDYGSDGTLYDLSEIITASLIEEYEKQYLRYSLPGTHLYEGERCGGDDAANVYIRKMKFNDWRKLPSIIPRGYAACDNDGKPC